MPLSKLILPSDPQDLKLLRFRDLAGDFSGEDCSPFDQHPDPAAADIPTICCDQTSADNPPPPGPAAVPEPVAGIDHERELEEAFRQGREEALREAREQFGHASDMLASALEEISGLRGSLLQNSSNDMLRLVMSIVRQILHAETSVNPGVIIDTIGRALQMAVKSDYYHVRVHPADLEIVTEHKPLFLASINGLKNLSFQPDPAIGRGGCHLESEIGDVDATIDGQLDQIHRSLLATLEQS